MMWLSLKRGFGGCDGLGGLGGFDGLGGFGEFDGFSGFGGFDGLGGFCGFDGFSGFDGQPRLSLKGFSASVTLLLKVLKFLVSYPLSYTWLKGEPQISRIEKFINRYLQYGVLGDFVCVCVCVCVYVHPP